MDSRIKFDLPKMKKPNKLPWPLIITALVLALIVLFVYSASVFWTEILWYKQLNYQGVLFTQWIAKAIMMLMSIIIFFVTMSISMYIAYRNKEKYGNYYNLSIKKYENRITPHAKIIFIILPIIVGIWYGIKLAMNWETVLLWWNSTSFGDVDPQFGYDISFYTFKLSFYSLLLQLVLAVIVFNTVISIIIYYIYGGIKISPRLRICKKAWVHISVMMAMLSLFLAGWYWLSRFNLLNGSGSKFDGAGYTDINALVPAKTVLAIIAILIAIMFIISTTRTSWKWPISGVAILVVSGLVAGNLYPILVQRFTVDPNAQSLESKYIQRNIDATLKAYGLNNVEKRTYNAVTTASAGQLREDAQSAASIRLLDPTIISPTFRQLQQNRQYYNFDATTYVDRYKINGKQTDTVVAVRELNQDGLGQAQRTWVNDHTVYTHGFGVVAAYGNKTQFDGQPSFWQQGIPSVGEIGKYEPRVYFGKNSPDYSIVGAPNGTKPQELDYPDDKAKNGQVNTTYKGNGGPSIANIFNKLFYAIKFGSYDIFFSKQVNEKSQILYDRDPVLRVKKVAPYLTLDKQSYPAVVDMDGNPKTPKRLVWIVDGYTTSDQYPYSAHESLEETTTDSRYRKINTAGNEVNYIRNSVKAIVDAYDGSVKLYTWDDKDPVLKTWNKIYPTSVKPMSEISGDLMSHLRYPEDLFKVQRTLLSRYHVTDASSFYSGGDFWKNPVDPTKSSTGEPQPPYYLTMEMPGQKKATFSLTSVFVPGGNTDREILTGYLAVDSETGSTAGKKRAGFGKLRLLELPRDLTVQGPGQVQNTFNSTNRVSTELNLLAQQSSEVVRGNLLTLPVGGGLLYVQPVYVQASKGTTFPLLRFVLVNFGEKVGFASTLQEALDQVFAGDSGVSTDENRKGTEDKSLDKNSQSLDAKTKLNNALENAKKAINDSNEALKKQDWTSYGNSQKQLQQSIENAVKAKMELDSNKK